MLRRSLLTLLPVIMSSYQAVRDIPAGASIAVGGFGLCGFPFELLRQLNECKTKELTLIGGTLAGPEAGVGPMARDGQLKKIITTYVQENKPLTDHLFRGEFEIEFCPMGSLIERIRAAGSGINGFYTSTGYGTAVSEGTLPTRFAADGSGPVSFSQPRETRFINGKWCCFETPLPTDYSFVRAWKADKRGNLIFRGTTRNFNLAVARCAKVCIAEVEEIVECGELDPNHVHVPGIYVHRLVCPHNIKKDVEFRIVRDKEGRVSTVGGGAITGGKFDLPVRHRIARRVALEVQDGMYLNLGAGLPNIVSAYLPPDKDVILQGENGLLGIGPHPLLEEIDCDVTNAGKQTVTIAKNGASLFDSEESFAMIRGGHMDLTVLGAYEVSENGDIASWYVPGKRISGMGGAMDLVQSGCTVLVCMEHTDKEGKSRILHQCSAPLTGKGVVDIIVTELAVFRITKSANGVRKLVLTEIDENTTLDEVKSKTEAAFTVDKNLKTMQRVPPLSEHKEESEE